LAEKRGMEIVPEISCTDTERRGKSRDKGGKKRGRRAFFLAKGKRYHLNTNTKKQGGKKKIERSSGEQGSHKKPSLPYVKKKKKRRYSVGGEAFREAAKKKLGVLLSRKGKKAPQGIDWWGTAGLLEV